MGVEHRHKEVNKKIYDEVHGYIELDELALSIIDLDVFQRLRRIKQLGVTYYVYPGAVHTRLSHSLGVYHIMRRLSERLMREGYISRDDLPVLWASALLHDIGHLPYSHALETFYTRIGDHGFEHEDLSKEIIISDTEVSEVLSAFGIDKHEVASIIFGRHREPLYNQLMSSDLDVDRMDYLVRDSLHTGVTYGSIDLDRLLETITVDRNGNIAVKDKGLIAAENFYIARLHMYRGVYYHKTSLGYELLLTHIWGELLRIYGDLEPFKSIEGLRALIRNNIFRYFDDYWVNGLFYRILGEKGKEGSYVADMIWRFLYRKGYKVCLDHVELIYGEPPSSTEIEENMRVEIRGSIKDLDRLDKRYYIIFADTIPIYKEEESVNIITREGESLKIYEYPGSFIGKLPKYMLIKRIYLHPYIRQIFSCP
ncbi:MAG: HD domain-containing protein [Desulfurococcales archaeon]|jgi:HD superfamily phosphohydrolase|nr:HD domain-containing protein [Desulfurococcales archaeon]